MQIQIAVELETSGIHNVKVLWPESSVNCRSDGEFNPNVGVLFPEVVFTFILNLNIAKYTITQFIYL